MLKFIALIKSFFEEIFIDVYFGFSTEREQIILVALLIFVLSTMVFILV